LTCAVEFPILLDILNMRNDLIVAGIYLHNQKENK
jgi:hypothetical protein